MRTQPFSWSAVPGFVLPIEARRLYETFPTEGFESVTPGIRSKKAYRMNKRRVLGLGEPPKTSGLSGAWRELIHAVLDESYTEAVAAYCGLHLDASLMEITLNRHPAECFVSPHVDHEEKAVTQLIYFNETWDPSWGGCLRILREPSEGAVVEEIPPTLGVTAFIVRSSESWHAVTEISPRARYPRMSLEVEFWNRRRTA